MKATYIFITLLLISGRLYAQQALPAPYSSTLITNSQRTWEAKAPIKNEADLISTSRTTREVEQTTTYLDGMGRELQTVVKQASPVGNDMITAAVYDANGRESLSYLPFVSNVATAGDITNNGDFKNDPFQQQAAFYNAYLAGQPGETNVGTSGLNWAYVQKNFEASPIERVTAAYAAGSSWVGAQAHPMQSRSLANTATDNVQKWNIAAAQGSLPVTGGAYTAGMLYKTVVTDEQGHQSIQFKNTDGQLILKKIQLTGTADNGAGTAHTGWLCTYYVYDDAKQLRFVIPPSAVKSIDGTWTVSQALADEFCYRIEYDIRHRPIIKAFPGRPSGSAGEVWMVYDQLDRLVLQQDANLRNQHKWQYFQYDIAGRVTSMGFITDAANYNNLSFHTTNAATSTAYPSPGAYTTEVLQQTFYDDYSWMNSTNSGTLSSSIDVTASGTGNSSFATSYNASPLYAQQMTQSSLTRGVRTGTKVAVLGTGQYIYTVYFYDDKGRVIQTQTVNITGGKDINTTQYDWQGKMLTNVLAHTKSGINAQSHKLVSQMNYDPQNRLLNITKTLNSFVNGQNIPVFNAQTAAYTYDELGQLKKKQLAPYYNGNTGLESVNYDYNIRGWSLGQNRSFVSGASTSNYFGYELGYDKTNSVATGNTYLAAAYNGNVNGMTWKSKGDGVNRKFDYQYDNGDRLTGAPYLQNTTAGSWDKSYIDYSLNSMSYDVNGNISGLSRNGFQIGGSRNIDNLTYTYANANSSNKLVNVMDASNDEQSKLGDFHYPAGKTAAQTDYTYDANGNAITDYNRGITTAITYNHLNLPQLITIPGKGSIQYLYDAQGHKWQKTVTESNATVRYNNVDYPTIITTTISYMGDFQYKTIAYSNGALSALEYTDKLLSVAHEEGRIRPVYNNAAAPTVQTGYVADYILRDHTGSTRVVLTDEAQVDIYPAATLETATYNGGTAQAFESQYYTINAGNVKNTATLSWLSSAANSTYQNQNNNGNPANTVNPYSNTTANSGQIYVLNGQTGDKTGLGITLKVMAGDQVSILGKSVWHNTGTAVSSYPINNALTAFLDAFANTGVVKGGMHSAAGIGTVPATTVPLNSMLGNTPSQPDPTLSPKAAINWILFDNQYRPVTMGTDLVSSAGDIVKSHALLNLPMAKSGYLYIYCSNESNLDVYFDNLQVVNTRGALLAETHYYPEGLAMSGISDKAWSKLQYHTGYQDKSLEAQEFSDGTGLDEYDFGARFYDQQLGVWHTQDAAGQFASPYSAMGNNPVMYADPDGNFAVELVIIGAIIGGHIAGMNAEMNGGKYLDGFWKGAIVGAVGGTLGQFGGGSFLSQIAWGAGEGAITGGLNAGLNGNNVWQGMASGAAYGAAFAAVTTTIEASVNAAQGYGFGTNDGRVAGMVDEYQKAATPADKVTKANNAIRYAQRKYGLGNVTMNYDPTELDYAVTLPQTGFVNVGPSAFDNAGLFKASLIHEAGHSLKDRLVDANGNFTGWRYPSGGYASTDPTLVKDGPIGYANEIYNAGRMHINYREFKPYNNLWKFWDNSKGNKWLLLIPQRFDIKALLKVY
jgi:RHS repeat-associated protein